MDPRGALIVADDLANTVWRITVNQTGASVPGDQRPPTRRAEPRTISASRLAFKMPTAALWCGTFSHGTPGQDVELKTCLCAICEATSTNAHGVVTAPRGGTGRFSPDAGAR